MMGNGKLVRTLIHTDVTKHLSFKAVDGSYVFVKGKVQACHLCIGCSILRITFLTVDANFPTGSKGASYSYGGPEISSHGYI